MALAETVHEGVALCRNGCVAWANSRLAKSSGHTSAKALVGLHFAELFRDTGSGLPRSESWRELDCALRTSNGRDHAVRLQRVEFADEGRSELWVVSDADASKPRPLESELDELKRRLKYQANRHEELLGFVAHELRSPLTLIAGYNQLLLSSDEVELGAEQRRFLDESSRSCRKIGAILERLSEEAQTGASPCESVRFEVASLEDTLTSALLRVDPLLTRCGVEVLRCLDPRTDRFRFDPSRIEQVFVNLLENAAKYAGNPGFVEISSCTLERGGKRFVEISLLDKGPGIAEIDRERVFESGVRLIFGNSEPGSGLGLHISRRIARAHGGDLRVIGHTGRSAGTVATGSVFVMSLPLETNCANNGSGG